MASVKITQEEADRLLKMLKYSLESEVAFPSLGDKTEFNVRGSRKQDAFTICIYRGKINRAKYNIGARITKNGVMLLELHIGSNGIHVNPDGTKVCGNHWHIYTEMYGRCQAFPADDINSEQFVENTLMFLDKFNVIEKPEINYQTEM